MKGIAYMQKIIRETIHVKEIDIGSYMQNIVMKI